MKNAPANQNGFTLVEVTLALAVVLIGLMGVLAMVANGIKSSRSAADNCVPAMIANDVFNQVRGPYRSYVNRTDLTTYRTPETTPEQQAYDINGAGLSSITDQRRYYLVSMHYEDVLPPSAPSGTRQNLTRVRVHVTWPAPNFPTTNTFISQVARLW
jgi:uncharacterized protein (TIGR02598 family)